MMEEKYIENNYFKYVKDVVDLTDEEMKTLKRVYESAKKIKPAKEFVKLNRDDTYSSESNWYRVHKYQNDVDNNQDLLNKVSNKLKHNYIPPDKPFCGREMPSSINQLKDPITLVSDAFEALWKLPAAHRSTNVSELTKLAMFEAKTLAMLGGDKNKFRGAGIDPRREYLTLDWDTSVMQYQEQLRFNNADDMSDHRTKLSEHMQKTKIKKDIHDSNVFFINVTTNNGFQSAMLDADTANCGVIFDGQLIEIEELGRDKKFHSFTAVWIRNCALPLLWLETLILKRRNPKNVLHTLMFSNVVFTRSIDILSKKTRIEIDVADSMAPHRSEAIHVMMNAHCYDNDSNDGLHDLLDKYYINIDKTILVDNTIDSEKTYISKMVMGFAERNYNNTVHLEPHDNAKMVCVLNELPFDFHTYSENVYTVSDNDITWVNPIQTPRFMDANCISDCLKGRYNKPDACKCMHHVMYAMYDMATMEKRRTVQRQDAAALKGEPYYPDMTTPERVRIIFLAYERLINDNGNQAIARRGIDVLQRCHTHEVPGNMRTEWNNLMIRLSKHYVWAYRAFAIRLLSEDLGKKYNLLTEERVNFTLDVVKRYVGERNPDKHIFTANGPELLCVYHLSKFGCLPIVNTPNQLFRGAPWVNFMMQYSRDLVFNYYADNVIDSDITAEKRQPMSNVSTATLAHIFAGMTCNMDNIFYAARNVEPQEKRSSTTMSSQLTATYDNIFMQTTKKLLELRRLDANLVRNELTRRRLYVCRDVLHSYEEYYALRQEFWPTDIKDFKIFAELDNDMLTRKLSDATFSNVKMIVSVVNGAKKTTNAKSDVVIWNTEDTDLEDVVSNNNIDCDQVNTVIILKHGDFHMTTKWPDAHFIFPNARCVVFCTNTKTTADDLSRQFFVNSLIDVVKHARNPKGLRVMLAARMQEPKVPVSYSEAKLNMWLGYACGHMVSLSVLHPKINQTPNIRLCVASTTAILNRNRCFMNSHSTRLNYKANVCIGDFSYMHTFDIDRSQYAANASEMGYDLMINSISHRVSVCTNEIRFGRNIFGFSIGPHNTNPVIDNRIESAILSFQTPNTGNMTVSLLDDDDPHVSEFLRAISLLVDEEPFVPESNNKSTVPMSDMLDMLKQMASTAFGRIVYNEQLMSDGMRGLTQSIVTWNLAQWDPERIIDLSWHWDPVEREDHGDLMRRRFPRLCVRENEVERYKNMQAPVFEQLFPEANDASEALANSLGFTYDVVVDDDKKAPITWAELAKNCLARLKITDPLKIIPFRTQIFSWSK
jgi:hypothetical protein